MAPSPSSISSPSPVPSLRHLERLLRDSLKPTMVGGLAGGVAHEFNNLLVGVLGNAELILMDLSVDSPLRPMLEDIEVSARKAARLTQQMLAFSGRMARVVRPINLTRFIQEMDVLLKVAVHRRADLSYGLEPDLPLVEADSFRLQEVVIHLLMNATEAFQGSGGRVVIRTGLCRLPDDGASPDFVMGAPTPGNYAFLEVADSGPGLPGELGDRIFEPFVAADPEGRGLGLAESLEIVRSLRGAIRARTSPEGGASFQVLLPVYKS